MKIREDFIRENRFVEIISNGGEPYRIPDEWRPLFDSCDMLVVIPDMHMYIYTSHQDNFKYGARAMLGLLDHLSELKESMRDDDRVLRVYQSGDFFESRFPSLADPGRNALPAEIILSHPDYALIEAKMDSLRTHHLYGNHDFELRHYPAYRFAAYEGRVYLEHGFTPDAWSQFSNPNAPLWEPAQFLFKGIRDVEAFFIGLLVPLGVIRNDEHFASGVLSGATERGEYPSNESYMENYYRQSDYYSRRLLANPDGVGARICIIGHTHQPVFLPFRDPNDPAQRYLFIDAGGWTEGRSDFVVVTDEEVAICRYRRDEG